MYKSFEVHNYRCFEELKIDDLSLVNLVGGQNNVGKTALLEAIYCSLRPESVGWLNALRGLPAPGPSGTPEDSGYAQPEPPWASLFAGFDLDETIVMDATEATGESRFLAISSGPAGLASVGLGAPREAAMPPQVQGLRLGAGNPEMLVLTQTSGETHKGTYLLVAGPDGVYPWLVEPRVIQERAGFLPAHQRLSSKEEADWFSQLLLTGKQGMLTEALREIEPRLVRLDLLALAGRPLLHGDIGIGRPVPLALMGEGMNRLAGFVLAIGNAAGGAVLIDEVENGLHHSALRKMWTVVAAAARVFDTQVFATTHSYECLIAAQRALPAGDFRYLRLQRLKGEIQAVPYEPETLDAAIEANLEVR